MHMLKIYKTIILIAMICGPLWWLMATDDGMRRTDTLILWLSGGDPININFKALDKNYTTDEWRKVYEDIPWECTPQKSSWGDEVCIAEISSYNGIPSRYISVYFGNNHISGVKLVYRNQYHDELGAELQYQLGRPQLVRGNDENTSEQPTLLQWQTDGGAVLIKQQLASGEEEASLIWSPGN